MDLARRTPTLSVAPAAPDAGYHDDLTPRPVRRRAPQTNRRNSRRTLTWAISGGCILFVAIMFGWFIIQAGMFEEAIKPVNETKSRSAKAPPLSVKQSVLQRPVFTGFDNNKQPYSISANTAKRDEDNPDIIYLDNVKGELKLRKSGDLILMTGNDGTYSSETKQLELVGDVRMISTGKYSAQTKAAKIDMPKKHLKSTDPVTVVFAAGVVKANGVEIWNGGERIVFSNRVKVHIPEQAKKGSE